MKYRIKHKETQTWTEGGKDDKFLRSYFDIFARFDDKEEFRMTSLMVEIGHIAQPRVYAYSAVWNSGWKEVYKFSSEHDIAPMDMNELRMRILRRTADLMGWWDVTYDFT